MEHTVLEYLEEEGKYTFAQKPFCEADCVVLCQLAYLKFDGIVPCINENKPSLSLWEVKKSPGFDGIFTDKIFERENRALFDRAVRSKRYEKLKLNCYLNILDKERQLQFGAITFLLPNQYVFVAFRGTDETFVGWKEDFNMAFGNPVPGQCISVKYLNIVGTKIKGDFYVGGHSKGGNLAIYSAVKCKADVQNRIKEVYSLDGPGFREEILKADGFEKINERIKKIIPGYSLIGMIFEKSTQCRVIESKGLGLMQHDLFTWIIKQGNLVEMKGSPIGKAFWKKTVNEWIISLPEEQKKRLINGIYDAIISGGVEDLNAFTVDKKKSMLCIIGAMKGLDKDTAKCLTDALQSLFEITGGYLLHKNK